MTSRFGAVLSALALSAALAWPTPARAESVIVTTWGGVVATGGPFTAVQASWIVPTDTLPAEADADVAVWVGFDGMHGSLPLFQAGTDTDAARTQAWWEDYPGPMQDLSLDRLSPGDLVETTLTEAAPDTWTVALKDVTQGTAVSTRAPVHVSGGTAECVVEFPPLPGAAPVAVPLATETLAGCQAAQAGGPLRPIGDYPCALLDLLDPSGGLAEIAAPPDADGSVVLTRAGGAA